MFGEREILEAERVRLVVLQPRSRLGVRMFSKTELHEASDFSLIPITRNTTTGKYDYPRSTAITV